MAGKARTPAKKTVKAGKAVTAKKATEAAKQTAVAKKAAAAAVPTKAPADARAATVTAAPPAPQAESLPSTPPAPPPMPAPRPAGPTASPDDVAAATEYLLKRVASRSSEPIYVDGKRLPTEEELLKMSDDEYMNEAQLAFFKYRLQQMEKELLANAGETTEHLRETVIVPDPADRATIEEEHALELRTRDRERKLLKKVQAALARIESGEYGYCEETGDPIGIPRLLARPTATLSLEAQQRREMKQKLFGE
ncbi:MAG: RNA polymerase-binding protein DksA [Burkholderiaceae bacterium]|nr:RNA polymerase-binding protein DksA [Burkholderiaceae bacterium]